MRKYLAMFGAAGLLAAMMMIGGCGSDDSNYYNGGSGVTTTATPTSTTATPTSTSTTATPTSTTATPTSTTATPTSTTSTSTTSTSTTTTTTTTTTLPATGQAVTGANTYSAAAADVTYTVTPGNYTVIITGFDTGDKIVCSGTVEFPAGANVSGADAVIDKIGCTNTIAGLYTTITLTGVDAAKDAQVFNKNSFNTAFGTGSLTP